MGRVVCGEREEEGGAGEGRDQGVIFCAAVVVVVVVVVEVFADHFKTKCILALQSIPPPFVASQMFGISIPYSLFM